MSDNESEQESESFPKGSLVARHEVEGKSAPGIHTHMHLLECVAMLITLLH